MLVFAEALRGKGCTELVGKGPWASEPTCSAPKHVMETAEGRRVCSDIQARTLDIRGSHVWTTRRCFPALPPPRPELLEIHRIQTMALTLTEPGRSPRRMKVVQTTTPTCVCCVSYKNDWSKGGCSGWANPKCSLHPKPCT